MIASPISQTSSKKRSRNARVTVPPLLSILALAGHIPAAAKAQSQSICSFGELTFQAGEALGNAFQTRCGAADEYPCFCAPERDPPIDCPYCGIATTVNDDQGLICARIGGPFIKVINLEGITEECSCNRDSSGNPQSTCLPPGSSGGNNPAPSPLQNDVCTLEWADGSIDIFQDGESYGELFETACGSASEFPCFCNVSMPSKLYCPYCSVPTPTGDLVCGGIDDTFAAISEDSQILACYCNKNLESECSPVSISTPTPAPTTPAPVPTTAAPVPKTTVPTQTTVAPVLVPVPSITLIPSNVPSSSPTYSTIPPFLLPRPTSEPVVSLDPTAFPSIRPPTVASSPIDKPSIWMPSRTPPVVLPMPGCIITDFLGNETFIPPGEILEVMEGPCSPLSSYPVLCNPNLPGRVEYPYCVFSSVDGTWESNMGGVLSDPSLVCAQNGEEVSVQTNSVNGDAVTCSCLYLNPYIGAVSSCPDFLVSVRLVWTASPTMSPSYGDLDDEPSSPQTTPDANEDQEDASSSAGAIRREVLGLTFVGWLLLSVVILS